MTIKQEALLKKHGTPEQFEKALLKAAMEFSIDPKDANDALREYKRQWLEAGEELKTKMKYDIPREWLASKAHLEDGVSLEAGCLIRVSPLEKAQSQMIDLMACQLWLYRQDENDARSERGAEPLWEESELTEEAVKQYYWTLLNPDVTHL